MDGLRLWSPLYRDGLRLWSLSFLDGLRLWSLLHRDGLRLLSLSNLDGLSLCRLLLLEGPSWSLREWVKRPLKHGMSRGFGEAPKVIRPQYFTHLLKRRDFGVLLTNRAVDTRMFFFCDSNEKLEAVMCDNVSPKHLTERPVISNCQHYLPQCCVVYSIGLRLHELLLADYTS